MNIKITSTTLLLKCINFNGFKIICLQNLATGNAKYDEKDTKTYDT